MATDGEERETKLGVDDGFVFPDLSGEGLRVIDRGVDALDAVYWDTPDFDLAKNGLGLRHRRTNGDTGKWTVKGPTRHEGGATVRPELEVEGSADAMPEAIRARLPDAVEASRLHPVLRIRTERHRRDIAADGDAPVLEVVDDHVEVLDDSGQVADRFRELEVEVMTDAGLPLVDRVVGALRAAGAGAPQSSSKLARGLQVLGHRLDVGADLE
jgi:inorganic triphosphatase YgiF